jgi:hypothetical protein
MPNSPVTRIFPLSYLYDALVFAIESSLKEFRFLLKDFLSTLIYEIVFLRLAIFYWR